MRTISKKKRYKLGFSMGNAKLIFTCIFNLPCGITCPGAGQCKVVVGDDGKIKSKGTNLEYRCYAGQKEMYENVRKSKHRNYDALLGLSRAGMRDLLLSELPRGVRVRIHESGDFFSQDYFDAWIDVARALPEQLFYGYTKSIPYLLNRVAIMPDNFRIVASYGGKYDRLITINKLQSVKVVWSVEEAVKIGLPIDHDDSLAYTSREDFCHLIHGTQNAGSGAGAAMNKMRRAGINGYRRRAYVA